MNIFSKAKTVICASSFGAVVVLVGLMAPLKGAYSASLTEGCNSDVWDAMTARADSKVAYDLGVAKEIIRKPDSVLEMTCFGQASRRSSNQGGAIFSGAFQSELSGVIEATMNDFLNTNFRATTASLLGPMGLDPAYGNAVTPVRGAARWNNTFNCDVMQDLWDGVLSSGTVSRAPFATFDDLMTGALTGDGPNLSDTLAFENTGTLSIARLNTAVAALPTPAIPSFGGTTDLCSVLIASGITATCP